MEDDPVRTNQAPVYKGRLEKAPRCESSGYLVRVISVDVRWREGRLGTGSRGVLPRRLPLLKFSILRG